MASKNRIQGVYTQKDTMYVSRVVYDVLVYTMSKCGIPRSRIPPTDSKANVYKRPHFVMVAGASALRIALIMRDKWRQMFESRQKSLGFKVESLPTFVAQLTVCCKLTHNRSIQSIVEVSLGLCNELMAFFFHEGITIDFDLLLDSAATNILFIIGSNKNLSETIETIFEKFDDICEYTRWLDDFIIKYAIPYASRDDVSDRFFEAVEEQHDHEVKTAGHPDENPAAKLVKERLGFLPHELFESMAEKRSIVLPESFGLASGSSLLESLGLASGSSLPECLKLASGSSLPGDRDSPEPPEFSKAPGMGTPKERDARSRRRTRSKKTPEKAVQGGESSDKPLEQQQLEDDLGDWSLGAEKIPQEGEGKKRSKPKKKAQNN